MNWLARLKKVDICPTINSTESKLGDAENLKKPFITMAANGPAPDPDRWCWPHSSAMNGAEIDTFSARLHQFTKNGMTELEAETLANKLVIRDREANGRQPDQEPSRPSKPTPTKNSKAKTPSIDTSAWRELDLAYQSHHINCSTCISAGLGYGLRCEVGATLWAAYSEAL